MYARKWGGTDSGWITNGSIKYRKIGEMVHVLIPSNQRGTVYATIGTLPTGYRPDTDLYYLSPGALTGTYTITQIQTDGSVMVGMSTSSTYSVSTIISFPLG